jgi:hypothetical protein
MHESTPFYKWHATRICHHIVQLIILCYSVGCHGNVFVSLQGLREVRED